MNKALFMLIAIYVNGCNGQKKCFVYGGGPFETQNICLDNFDIDDSLVTRTKYEHITKTAIRNDSCVANKISEYSELTYYVDDSLLRPNDPVSCVNYQEAEKYCQLVGGRLPTEEEWEFAAKNARNFNGRELFQMKSTVFQWTSTDNQRLSKNAVTGLLSNIGNKNDGQKYRKSGCKKCDTLQSEPYMKSPAAITFRAENGGFRCAYDE